MKCIIYLTKRYFCPLLRWAACGALRLLLSFQNVSNDRKGSCKHLISLAIFGLD